MRDPRKTATARSLRLRQTDAERALWPVLRRKAFLGLKFRRQEPLGPYVVDFLCSSLNLVIEADGGQHSEDAIAVHDQRRTQWLEAAGYRVLRFWNNEILTNREGVAMRMKEAVEEAHRREPREGGLSPSP